MNERVTVELDSEALARARAAGADISRVLDRALRRAFPPLAGANQTPEQWYRENKEAVDSCNNFIERHGLLATRLRYRAGRE